MKPKRIFLTRHGESEANVNPEIYSRIPDHRIQITERGQQQARELGRRLKHILGGEELAIYLSPFRRTKCTTDEIVAQIGQEKIKRRREEPRLREQEWGHFRTGDEITRIEAERKAYGIFYYRLPGGESGADVYDRATGVIDTLFRDFQKPDFPRNLLIVTHGLTLRLLLMRWLHWSVEDFEESKNPENCELYEMVLDEKADHYALTCSFPRRVGDIE